MASEIALTKSLNNLIEKEKKISEKDYNNMIKQFRLQDKLEQRQEEKQRKNQEQVDKWRYNLSKALSTKEEAIEDRREHIIKKLSDREKKRKKSLEKRSKSPDLKKQKEIEMYGYKKEDIVEYNIMLQNEKDDIHRERLQEKIYDKIKKIEEKNNKNMQTIKERFSKRLAASHDHVRQNIILNKKEDNLYLKELKLKPLIRYQEHYVNLNMHSYDDMRHKSEDYEEKLEKVLKKVEKLELVQKSKINKVLRRYNKIMKQNKENRKDHESQLHELGENLRYKSEVVLNRKHNKDLIESYNNEKYLDKQYEKLRVVDEIEHSLESKVNAIYDSKILGQIINDRKMNSYMRKLNQIKHDNVTLKPHDQQRRIYIELKRKELAEKQKKEEALRKKQLGEL